MGLYRLTKAEELVRSVEKQAQEEKIHALLSETRKLDVTRKEQEQQRKGRETKKGKEEGTEGAGRRT